jgi:hypothetical protein
VAARAAIIARVRAACTGVALGALGALRVRQPDAAPAIERALPTAASAVSIVIVLVLAWQLETHASCGASPFIFARSLPSIGSMPSTARVADRAIVEEPPPWARAAERVQPAGAPLRRYRPAYMFGSARFAPERASVTVPRAPSTADATSELETEALADAIATFGGASGWRWGIAAANSEDPARPVVHDQVWHSAAREGGALLDRFGIASRSCRRPRRAAQAEPARETWTLGARRAAGRPAASVMRGWQRAVARGRARALVSDGWRSGVLRGSTVPARRRAIAAVRWPPLPCTIERRRSGTSRCRTSDTDGTRVVPSTAAPG